ncbi:ATP-binding cassette domain-containing protein [Clostridium bornimense]|uniref:ATP-binding cassette domain-containing protein n=1 Tax=Clostridium bornimense TaxID=1216932 RepID=UPI001C111E1E|nr:ATP-binding cassette domain-containing protein [Clostridium bornimense]
MNILEVENLKYMNKYINKCILKDINIKFEKGKLYVITGKSDLDRSTLLGVIAGLDNYDSGNIIYQNKDLRTINKDIYRNKYIGTIFKDYNIIKDINVLDNMLLRLNKNNMREVEDILSIVGIQNDKLLKKVDKLTKAEKKKVFIAKALCNDPDIIISDDIIEDCDEGTTEIIINIFCKLAYEYNKCIIISTNSYTCATYANELWGMNNGKLIYIRGK